MSSDTYQIGAFITGIIGAIILWIYAMSQWGLLIGLVVGWIPALIGGFIIGLIWPLLALAIGALILFLVKNS